MRRSDGFDTQALLFGYCARELTAEEERVLFEAAAMDQDLFDQLAEAERVRSALDSPEERQRALAVLRTWEDSHAAGELPQSAVSQSPSGVLQSPLSQSPVLQAPVSQSPVPRAPLSEAAVLPAPAKYAALRSRPERRTPALWSDLLRSILSTVATAISLRLGYAAMAAIGSSLVRTGLAPTGDLPGAQVPPVPAILHLVHAAIAALLLAIQFTPFLKPQAIEQDHPIARKCLAQFIAGWRWAWVAWLALYGWLWTHASSGAGPDIVADILNCLTSFPLFWCFFVLDKPSVSVPGDPGRNASFRKAIGTIWGIGAGVALLAVAGRLHMWGLNEFGLVFLGIYDGLAIAFLVGRFDSHWMKVPRWMLAPLYGYALIQMIYVFFYNLPAEWQIYTYLVALLFKVCLFLVVTHLLNAGNLRVYLEAAEDGKLGPASAVRE